MVVTSRTAQTGLTRRPPAQNELGWLLAVAAAFLLVHIAAWTICGHASRIEAANSRPKTICLSCD
jgi:ABC-type uncharacterized transport system permease subunit